MVRDRAAHPTGIETFMGVMVMEQNLLTAGHRRLLGAITKSRYLTERFYFTGGTALSAYYLHHRYSEDLDLFTETPYSPRSLEGEVKRAFRALKPTRVELETLHGQHVYFVSLASERIKVDFAYYPFEHLGVFVHQGRLRVASLLDITVNKVHAITTRKRGRDFLDLYLALKNQGMNQEALLNEYRLKFDVVITREELAKHYAGVVDALDQPRYLGSTQWKDVEEFFIQQAKTLSVVS